MVSLGSSFTIVGNNNFNPTNTNSFSLTTKTSISTNEDEETENIDLDNFNPPKATWYDETHQHFVALTGHTKQLPQQPRMIDSNLQSGEIVYYQILRFPEQTKNATSSSKSDICEENSNSDSALDEVSSELSQTKSNNQNCLERSHLFPIFLPYNLSRQNVPTKRNNKNHNSSPSHLPLRIPMIAKFSLNMKFLALQFSPTLIRIVRVSPEQIHTTQEKEQHNQKFSSPIFQNTKLSASLSSFDPYENPRQYDSNTNTKPPRSDWTLDLAKDFPVSLDESFPENWDQVAPSTTLISNGIIWSDHEANSQDLILVTTTAVIFYKVSKNQLVKSLTYDHTANAFWYEPKTRALLIASSIPYSPSNKDNTRSYSKSPPPKFASSKKSNKSRNINGRNEEKVEEAKRKKHVFEMRTYFLRFPKSENDVESNGLNVNFDLLPYSNGLPIVEAPNLNPHRLRRFVLGSHRLDIRISNSNEDSKTLKWNTSITYNDVYLFNLYGEPYCVEVGCLGYNEGINVIHLDKVKQEVTIVQTMRHECDGSFNISVIDNLLAVHYKKDKVTFLYDIHNHRGGKLEVKAFESSKPCDELYDDRHSLLSPNYLLDPSKRGRVYTLELDLKSILSKTSLSRCTVPFLLNREQPKSLTHSIVLEQLVTFIETQNLSALKGSSWCECIAEMNAKKNHSALYDIESCFPIIFRATLLPCNRYSNYERLSSLLSHSNTKTMPSSDSNLTQTDIVEKVLLLQAERALEKQDLSKFEFVCSVSCLLMEALTMERVEVSPALEVLVVSMLWRLGRDKKVLAMLRCRRKQFVLKQKSFQSFRDKHAQQFEKLTIHEKRDVIFAEIIVFLSNEMKIGIGVGKDEFDDATTSVKDMCTEELKALSFDILCANSSYHVTAKYLLNMGKIEDAIILCLKAITISRNATNQPTLSKFSNIIQNSFGEKVDINAIVFFRAAIEHCEKMKEIGDRVRHFCFLFSFLRQWEPDTVVLSKAQGDSQILSSLLAEKHPQFPCHLLGGQESEICKTIASMYGYNNLN